MSQEWPPLGALPLPSGPAPKASIDSTKEKPNVAGNGD